jgi:hypothetical protein
MNSLYDLNHFSSTTIVTYTDSRTPAVMFDRITPTNGNVNINEDDTHTVPVGAEIVDIIRGADCLPKYIINVSSCAGATVSWTTVPSGCVVTNPSTGVYQISNVLTVDIWNTIKNPIVSIPHGFTGTFTYTAKVAWNTTDYKQWSILVSVADITYMTTPTGLYFFPGQTGTVTGNPTILSNIATTWTVTVTPSITGAITNMSSTGAGGTSTFNSSTKVLTITGTKSQCNSHLNSIAYVTDNFRFDFQLVFHAIADAIGDGDTKNQDWYTLAYLTQTRSSDTYTLNTTTSITGGPLIVDDLSTGLGTYTMTVVPNPTSAVNQLSSIGRYGVGQTLTPSPDRNAYLFGQTAVFSLDNEYMFISVPGYAGKGAVFFYTKTSGTYGKVQTIEPSGNPESFGQQILISSDKNTLIVVSNDNYVYVFTRSGTTWTEQTALGPYTNPHTRVAGISSDGNKFMVVIPATTNGLGAVCSFRYMTRSGSTWTSTTVSSGISDKDTYMGYYGIGMNAAADKLFVSEAGWSSNTGRIHYYTRSGSTWTKQTSITETNTAYPAAPNHWFMFMGFHESDATITAYSQGGFGSTYFYTLVGSTWTLQSSFAYGYGRVTGNGQLFVNGPKLYKKINSVWTEISGSNIDPNLTGGLLSYDTTYAVVADIHATVDGYTNSGTVQIYTQGAAGTTWNGTTHTLTLSGTRSQVNLDVDTIILTPGTDYTDNFILTYTLTTPSSITDTRDQTITYTA